MRNQYFAFQWHITDDCDQRCRHCYIWAERTQPIYASGGRQECAAEGSKAAAHSARISEVGLNKIAENNCKVLDSMTWDEMQHVVANCEDFCETYRRTPYFYITGGDPILHKDFWKLMELMKEKGYPFTIMGNPFHLTPEVCGRLKECGCQKYQMSLDGLEEIHDWFRKPGSYRTTLEKVKLINDSGIRSVIMTTVSGKNIQDVPGIIDAVVDAGVNIYAFSRYCPTSEEKADEANENYMSPQQYRELLEKCDEKFNGLQAAGCQTYFNKKDHLWILYEYEKGTFRIPEKVDPNMIYGGCNCGNCHITITPTGDVYACRRVQNSRVANIFEERLADIWINQMENYRQFDRFKKCAGCELLAWCRGCPAVASGARGDFYDADPQCWKRVEG